MRDILHFELASTPVVKIEENPSLSAEHGNKNLNDPIILIMPRSIYLELGSRNWE